MGTAEWALAVSVFALVAALASLVWQIIAFQRSGHLVSLRSGWGVWHADPNTDDERHFAVYVTAMNAGRLPVDITDLYVGRDGLVRDGSDEFDGPGLPYRLEVGSSAHWEYPLLTTLDAGTQVGYFADSEIIIVTATLGNGTTVFDYLVSGKEPEWPHED